MTDTTDAPQATIPLDEVRALLAEKDRAIAELSDRAANLAVEVVRRDKQIAGFQQILADKDAEIAALKATTAAASRPAAPGKARPPASSAPAAGSLPGLPHKGKPQANAGPAADGPASH